MDTHERALAVIQDRAQGRPFYERLYPETPQELASTPLTTPGELLGADDSPLRTGTAQNIVSRRLGPRRTVALRRSGADTDAMASSFTGYTSMLPDDRITCILMGDGQAGTDFTPYMQQYRHGYVIIDPTRPDMDAALLDKADIGAVLGRPDSIHRLADSITDSDIDTIVTAGPITVGQHQRLQGAFPDADLHQGTGLLEAGFMGFSCEDSPINGFHVPGELYHIEAVDPRTGEPVPDGEEGDIVVTTLWDGSMALNRYRTGWRGRLEDDHDCDREGQRIRITGQAAVGSVRLRSGQVHISAIEDALERCSIPDPFRLVLEEDQVQLVIDPGREYSDTTSAQDAIARRLMGKIRVTADHTWRQLAGSGHLPELTVRFGNPGRNMVEDRRFPA